MSPKDLFSSNANQYATFRPDYPNDLFDFIFSHVTSFSSAWDCATGNGQAAKVLARKFDQVQATDISEKQMESGFRSANITYSISPAEKSNFPDQSFDLITVAQAAHWFKLELFYQEVKRVAKPGCIVALWGYGLLSVNPDFDVQLKDFYKNVVGPYWDPERILIDASYATIPFPFQEINCPDFSFTKQWNITHLEGYLNTWSATQKYIATNKSNPVTEFISASATAFGEGAQEVKFPLFMRLGRVGV
jgi:SAM-dependent methyltransferase